MHAWLQVEFPHLKTEQYKVTSLYSDEYNCIAWAANDTESWWWPSEDGYWPLDANKWTSNLGQAWDIEHSTPQGVECETYGSAAQYLKRPLSEKRMEEIERSTKLSTNIPLYF